MILRLPVRRGEDDCPLEAGHEYTLPLPSLAGRHRIRVDVTSRQRLALVTFAEAKRELGHHRSQSDWRAKWVRRHDKGWCRRHPTASDADCARRFSAHWSSLDAWVMEFVLVEGAPRLLATQGAILGGHTVQGSEYTVSRHKSIDPDVEAVDAVTLGGFAAKASERTARDREVALQARAERRRDRLRRLADA